jgi:hypothetical protein
MSAISGAFGIHHGSTIPVNANDTLTFSGWAKMALGGSGQSVVLALTLGGTTDEVPIAVNDASFVYGENDFVAPATGNVSVRVYSTGSLGQCFLADDLVVVKR